MCLVTRVILAEQRRHLRAKDEDAFFLSDEAMHAALMEIAGHERSWRLVQSAKTQIDRVRRLAVHMPRKMDAQVEEHQTIIVGGDRARCRRGRRGDAGCICAWCSRRCASCSTSITTISSSRDAHG